MLEMTESMQAKTEEQAVKLTDNARVVLMKRYVRRGPDGKRMANDDRRRRSFVMRGASFVAGNERARITPFRRG